LESAYEVCLAHELRQRGLAVEIQKPLPVVYKDVRLDAGYRIDILCENWVLIELKSVDAVMPVHVAQAMTYLKLSGLRLGFLMNLNARLFKDGCQRIVV
jgi:GxxExxY protein